MANLHNTNTKKIILILSLICSLELLSFIVFLIPSLGTAVFFALIASFLVLSLVNLEYAFWVVLTELVIGSKGYLFYLEADGLILPIRIAFWLIIMSAWIANAGKGLLKKDASLGSIVPLIKSPNINYILALALFTSLGLLTGYLQQNTLPNIFFDFNAWLYFLLIFPAYSIFSSGKKLNNLKLAFTAAIAWLSVKTFVILYLFSHNFSFIGPVYKWIRSSGVGEITLVEEGFYRIFFQSHVFIIPAFFLLYFLYSSHLSPSETKQSLKKLFVKLVSLSTLLSVILITLSRSFWLGVAAGVTSFFAFQFIIKKQNYKQLLTQAAHLSLVAILSIIIIISIVKFPFPSALGDYSTTSLLANRTKIENNESAVSSRWALLPKLWTQIKSSPMVGKGFGSIITYTSSDPRVQASTAAGEYTTYAFEWGWLDIWLKTGIFGLLAYLALIAKLLIGNLKLSKKEPNNTIHPALFISLLSLVVVNIFSPYFNHPLGIGFLIILIIIHDLNLLKI